MFNVHGQVLKLNWTFQRIQLVLLKKLFEKDTTDWQKNSLNSMKKDRKLNMLFKVNK